MIAMMRRYFISGLLLLLPLWVTLLVIRFLVDIFSNTMLLLPRQYQPDILLGFHIPGIGLLITLGIIFLSGVIATNFLGKSVVRTWDAFIDRIPLVRSIYNSVKQVSQTLFTPGGQSFRKVLLVQYPCKGSWTIAFQTGDSTPVVDKALENNDMVSLYVPTTPNPTSGFLLIVARKDVIEIDMSVDQALKFVISLGVVQPNGRFNKNAHQIKLELPPDI